MWCQWSWRIICCVNILNLYTTVRHRVFIQLQDTEFTTMKYRVSIHSCTKNWSCMHIHPLNEFCGGKKPRYIRRSYLHNSKYTICKSFFQFYSGLYAWKRINIILRKKRRKKTKQTNKIGWYISAWYWKMLEILFSSLNCFKRRNGCLKKNCTAPNK